MPGDIVINMDERIIREIREDIERQFGPVCEERALLVDYANCSAGLQALLADYLSYPFNDRLRQRMVQQLEACVVSLTKWEEWLYEHPEVKR